MNQTKRVVVLGSTGSIGRQTLQVAKALADHLRVIGLAAGGNAELLLQQVQEFKPRFVYSPSLVQNRTLFRERLSKVNCQLLTMEEMVSQGEVDLVVIATAGKVGLPSTLAAIRAGKRVALANKEVLVMAGEIMMTEAAAHGVDIWPIDSEHSAIWQCLRSEAVMDGLRGNDKITRLVLTASGGALRDYDKPRLAAVSPEEVLQHPTWSMGKKVTVDSATLMNKGLEVIEAHWLFKVDYERITIVLHRQSIVHSLVEFIDGSMKAQLSLPDMRLPIQYALTYPERLPNALPRLDLIEIKQLTFEPIDLDRFPCLRLAGQAGRSGGTYPAVLSAADEESVQMFLSKRIGFLEIATVIEEVLSQHQSIANPTLDEILEADRWSRRKSQEIVGC